MKKVGERERERKTKRGEEVELSEKVKNESERAKKR